MHKNPTFKEAILRAAQRDSEFEGFKFKVKPLVAVDGRKAMRHCAALFTPDPERDPTEIRCDLDLVLKTPNIQTTIDLIGINPETEPERLLFIFENWQNMQLALCVVTTEAEPLDLLEMIRVNPEFRQLIHDTATGKKTPPVEAEAEAKNA